MISYISLSHHFLRLGKNGSIKLSTIPSRTVVPNDKSVMVINMYCRILSSPSTSNIKRLKPLAKQPPKNPSVSTLTVFLILVFNRIYQFNTF